MATSFSPPARRGRSGSIYLNIISRILKRGVETETETRNSGLTWRFLVKYIYIYIIYSYIYILFVWNISTKRVGEVILQVFGEWIDWEMCQISFWHNHGGPATWPANPQDFDARELGGHSEQLQLGGTESWVQLRTCHWAQGRLVGGRSWALKFFRPFWIDQKYINIYKNTIPIYLGGGNSQRFLFIFVSLETLGKIWSKLTNAHIFQVGWWKNTN